jgi:GDP-mannose 6-dehydrogenase
MARRCDRVVWGNSFEEEASVKVSIMGLGYVGAVSCGCFARDGHDVIGVDVNPDKVQMIADGKAPIIEDEIGDIIDAGVKSGKLRASSDVRQAVLDTELTIISVGTPSQPNGSIDLIAIERVCEEIGAAIGEKADRHLVVVRSTVLPGSVRKIVIPTLEKASNKKAGEGFAVCFNPEFLREGSSVRDHYDPPFTLIGCDDEADGKRASALYAGVKGDVLYSSIEAAELVKYACNAFHALKITFANEMGILAQSAGVDSHQVMDLVCKDTKLNISARYMKPGFAFGGSCLPKDLRALLYQGKRNDIELPLLAAIMESNRTQIERAVEMIVALKKKKVGLLGLSFKHGTDDLRESPLVTLAERLIGKGYDLRIYDQYISMTRLVGANKKYIEKEIPHISSLLVTDFDAIVGHSDILVIGNGAPEFDRVAEIAKPGQIVLDLVRRDALKNASNLDYRGVAW